MSDVFSNLLFWNLGFCIILILVVLYMLWVKEILHRYIHDGIFYINLILIYMNWGDDIYSIAKVVLLIIFLAIHAFVWDIYKKKTS
jgi:hypothetical protein